MRAKSIALFFMLVVFSMSVDACFGRDGPENHLSSKDVDDLSLPIYTKKIIPSDSGKFLIVTKDYGSGLELRDAYIYQSVNEGWQLMAYKRTREAKLDSRISGKNIEVFSGVMEVILSVSID
ncbi:hypothetical protein [Lysobacter capsici]|uniref:hypothetical protein n=1 Tax=Lysobacter capsici TaxID=435897 RepID=UPI00287B7CC1|nr:hypothetical protein [Lysobacter capsici]WND81882.1 hypothetical protein RJ610_05815 [Lysobacter capsici]WND87078.1 hypothetical protein RJ609_05820 [Lysobacter capsici]